MQVIIITNDNARLRLVEVGSLNPVSALHDSYNAEGFWPKANWRSFYFGRSNQIETALPYQPKQAVLLRILLGHDFFIGKSRLWLAERAKYRGSHGGASSGDWV
jgi:hypothetical protein